MSLIFSKTPSFSMEKSPKIIVIGGGIAGLTTAYRLQREGMDVDLYEARGRIGGRIFTAIINGRFVELGAQNILDGGKAENLSRLLDEFELERIYSQGKLKHSYFDGENLIPFRKIAQDKKMDPKILKKTLDQLAATCRNMKEIIEEIVDPEDPLYKILAVRMAAYEGGSIDKLCPLYTETLFHMLLGGVCSVHQGNSEEDGSIDLVTVAGGNAKLCQKLGEKLGSKLHLNMPLTKMSKDQNNLFQLTFQNGKEIEADIVVLAMPCSVYNQIIFENDVIPLQTLQAIQNVEYGANAKIMVPFENLPSPTGLVGDKMVAFFDMRQQMLTVYYMGEASRFSPDTIADTYTEARPMMEKGYESHCPAFATPLYAKDEADLSYEGPVGYSWMNDPYAKGTYSYIASGQEDVLTSTMQENGETFKTLFAPIHQKLYFAGEHASILSEVPGTMESACESGERIARAILQKIHLP